LVHRHSKVDVLQVLYLLAELLFFTLDEFVIFFMEGEEKWHADKWAVGRGKDDISSSHRQILHITSQNQKRVIHCLIHYI
jgi:hypothetical protein